MRATKIYKTVLSGLVSLSVEEEEDVQEKR